MPDQRTLAPLATAELLAVGAELLVGETRDTNSGDIARELTALGVEVRRMTQLPDDQAVVTDALRQALQRVDLVITSGGLGPTPDDLTREAIAAALSEEPAVDPDLEAWLRSLWAKRGLPFSDTNLKQAWLIPSATAMDNPNGTAPGWWVEREGRIVVALPGPPRELQPMWREHVLPRLRARGLGLDRAVTTLHLIGIGESALVDLVGRDLLENANPRMATYARPDFVDLRVSAIATSERTAEQLVTEAVAGLSPRVDAYVFGRDDDDWITALTPRLAGRRLAVAEAGTGGHLGLLLGSAPFLVHAEIDPTLTDAAAAAADARSRHGTEVGLAVIAGEDGDDLRVSIGLDLEGDRATAQRTVFRGGVIGRRRSANAALAELWRRLADEPPGLR
jgi:nicotinamide-nucleotide amidase